MAETKDAIWTPPTTLAEAKLLVMHEKPNGWERRWEITNAGFGDEHIPTLLNALHHSECALTELDLAFNKITDAGLMQLCEALARDGMCAYELTSLRLGANRIGDKAREVAVELMKSKRPDLTLNFEAVLLHPTRLLTVGKVFAESPAAAAGLQRDDYIVAIGMCNFAGKERNRGFKSEAERHMDAVQWSDSRRHLLPKAGNKPQKALELLTTGPLGPLVPATTSLTPATMAVSPTNVPAECISDDCFKFFNPVSTESLTQYTAQWTKALMRASQYLSDEHLGKHQNA